MIYDRTNTEYRIEHYVYNENGSQTGCLPGQYGFILERMDILIPNVVYINEIYFNINFDSIFILMINNRIVYHTSLRLEEYHLVRSSIRLDAVISTNTNYNNDGSQNRNNVTTRGVGLHRYTRFVGTGYLNLNNMRSARGNLTISFIQTDTLSLAQYYDRSINYQTYDNYSNNSFMKNSSIYLSGVFE